MPTLAEIREAFYASLLTVPFHKHLGITLVGNPAAARVALPAKPEILRPDGSHSPAAVYSLADIAGSIQICEEVASRALELEMGVIFYTVFSRFQSFGTARGTIEADAQMLSRLDPAVGGPSKSKKATLEVEATVSGEDGEPVGQQRMGFYVRFMEVDLIRGMVPESSEIFRVHGL